MLGVQFGETQGWWHVPNLTHPYFLFLLWLGFSISCAPVYLITWRIARRSGGLGLLLCVAASAIIGPPRDYAVARTFPDWMVFSPGIAPVLAVAAIYALLIAVGHGLMRMVAGPSAADPLRP